MSVSRVVAAIADMIFPSVSLFLPVGNGVSISISMSSAGLRERSARLRSCQMSRRKLSSRKAAHAGTGTGPAGRGLKCKLLWERRMFMIPSTCSAPMRALTGNSELPGKSVGDMLN
jgi:hypothetical protein